MDFYKLLLNENIKKDILSSFLSHCKYKSSDQPLNIKSELLNLFILDDYQIDSCIKWDGSVSKKKTKNAMSITPIFKYKNFQISEKNFQISAKNLSIYLYYGLEILKGEKIHPSCNNNLCINPLHLISKKRKYPFEEIDHKLKKKKRKFF